MTDEPVANQLQNTPSADDLDAQIKADEAARYTPDAEAVEEVKESDEEKEPVKEPEPEKSEDDEYEKRIKRLAFKEREARQIARQLTEENARLRGAAPPLDKDAEIERQVELRATQLAEQKLFNDKAAAIYQDGIRAFPSFQDDIASLREASMSATGAPLSNQVVEAAIEVGDPHKVLHWLAGNTDEAERIMALPPVKLGAAMAKIAAKLSAIAPTKPQSKAPPPIKPLAGKGKAEESDEKMPIAEYMKREDERMRARR